MGAHYGADLVLTGLIRLGENPMLEPPSGSLTLLNAATGKIVVGPLDLISLQVSPLPVEDQAEVKPAEQPTGQAAEQPANQAAAPEATAQKAVMAEVNPPEDAHEAGRKAAAVFISQLRRAGWSWQTSRWIWRF